MSTQIKCPSCNTPIEIDRVLSEQVIVAARAKAEAEIAEKKRGVDKLVADLKDQAEKQAEQLREAKSAIEKQKSAIAAEKAEIERLISERAAADVQQRLSDERKKWTAEESARLRAASDVELKDREARIAELLQQNQAMKQTELDLRRRERELQTKADEIELTVQRRLTEAVDEQRAAIARQLAEQQQFKDAEKDKLIGDMKKQMEDLRLQMEEAKRRAEQGSQQLQGEVLELALEEQLRRRFAHDAIEPVAKGVHGGDVLQRVIDAGQVCGTILWETKRTKNWDGKWLAKLRADQRDANAELAILVSVALPPGVTTFEQIDEVWVCNWANAPLLASALRAGLLELGAERRTQAGAQTKMEHVYRYLGSAQFRNRLSGVAEAFETLREELAKEKKATLTKWARQEKQIELALQSATGMYGDLKGLMNTSLPALPALEGDEPPAGPPRLTGS